jgi:hypothetical protein
MATPCLAQASFADQPPARTPASASSGPQNIRPASSAAQDEAPAPSIETESPGGKGATVVHIPNTSSAETGRDNAPLTGVGNAPFGLSAIIAWLALALALAACGLFAWQRYMSPLRAAAADELESDLRDLVREELNARQDSQVAALKAQIARLEARLAELEGAAREPFPGAAAQAAAPAVRRGPAPIPADYFDDNRQEPRARPPARGQPAAPARPAVQADALRPAPSQPPRQLSQSDAIAFLKNDVDYGRMLELYRRCLAGERGALNDFSEMHQPVGVVEDADGRFIETDDPEPAIWFVEVASSDTHGVLLPARKVMRDWDRSYRPMSGHKATAVFGSSYDILPGDRLSIANPAWAQRTGPASFARVARGELTGR